MVNADALPRRAPLFTFLPDQSSGTFFCRWDCPAIPTAKKQGQETARKMPSGKSVFCCQAYDKDRRRVCGQYTGGHLFSEDVYKDFYAAPALRDFRCYRPVTCISGSAFLWAPAVSSAKINTLPRAL
jgi:hypothetical protein